MEEFDLGIVGAGPAGYTAALHGASLGQKVVLFEKILVVFALIKVVFRQNLFCILQLYTKVSKIQKILA